MNYESINELPKDKLIELSTIYAKNWLATDGLWFQGVEQHHGFDQALHIDKEMWKQFTVIEANRIKQFLALPKRAGLEGLKQALQFRLYAPLNEHEIIIQNDVLTYRVITCRVQYARERKGMAYHTCKPVGIIEYSLFAKTIDDRIETECISCHPDVTDISCNCCWKFSLAE
jgi:hypothetical protein